MNQQNKYPLINRLSLYINSVMVDRDYSQDMITAPDLEAVLQKAVVVYSNADASGDLYEWTKEKYAGCTHQALLIGIRPIKEKTTLEKISEVLEKFRETNNNLYLADEIKKLIEAENENN